MTKRKLSRKLKKFIAYSPVYASIAASVIGTSIYFISGGTNEIAQAVGVISGISGLMIGTGLSVKLEEKLFPEEVDELDVY